MDTETVRALAQLNNRFYRQNHDSFSKTRNASWPGWQRVCASFPAEGERPFRVLDAASGNMRFERFLLDAFPQARFSFTCVDSCAELAQEVAGARFVNCDVIESLLNDRFIGEVPVGEFDAAVSFGFMHHVPSAKLRQSLAGNLVSSVRAGGIVALSFWQFMDDPRLSAQAMRVSKECEETREFNLESGDYFLGWNSRPGVYRYCHHFTSEELDGLALALADRCQVVDRFNADGKSGSLNAYLVLRRL